MPQKDKLIRKEYNRQQYILKKNKEQPIEKESNSITDNYYLLKFFKNIQKVNDLYLSVTLTPIKVEQDLKTKIIDDINKYIIKNINRYDEPKFKFNYVVLELKFRNKSFIDTEPKYKGKCYTYLYVKGSHDLVTNTIYKWENNILYYRADKLSDYYRLYFPNYREDDEGLEKFFELNKENINYYLDEKEEYKAYKNKKSIYYDDYKKNTYLKHYYEKNFPNYQKDKNKLEKWFFENKKDIEKYLFGSSSKRNILNNIKIKRVCARMNYNHSPIGEYHFSNFKKYNNITNEATNEKLEADHVYDYYDPITNHKKGWKFNKITIKKLKTFCKTNGLDQKISKDYNYGNYVNWILKVLN